jgi:uncharacterized protein (DUF2062 family)
MTIWAKASKHRWLEPFLDLLRQGMSPEKISLTIALGIILGVTPVLGSTTLLCTMAAIALRLNLPAIQLVNMAVYPLQLILLIPFYKMGAWMFRADTSTISLQGIAALARTGVWNATQSLWVVTVHAFVAWFVLGWVATALLYTVAIIAVRRAWKTIVKRSSSLPSVQ